MVWSKDWSRHVFIANQKILTYAKTIFWLCVCMSSRSNSSRDGAATAAATAEHRTVLTTRPMYTRATRAKLILMAFHRLNIESRMVSSSCWRCPLSNCLVYETAPVCGIAYAKRRLKKKRRKIITDIISWHRKKWYTTRKNYCTAIWFVYEHIIDFYMTLKIYLFIFFFLRLRNRNDHEVTHGEIQERVSRVTKSLRVKFEKKLERRREREKEGKKRIVESVNIRTNRFFQEENK